MFPGGVAAVAGVPGRCGGGCCRGLFAFLPIICGLHVAVFGVSSYYMEKLKPGGVGAGVPGGVGAGVRFLLKKRTKKTRKRVKIFIKKC